MSEQYLLPVKDILTSSQNLNFDASAYLKTLADQFQVSCTINHPLDVSVHLEALNSGILVRGTLEGIVTLICDRCAEDYEQKIAANFESFEANPENEQDHEVNIKASEPFEPLETRIILDAKNNLVLDLGAILWEEFLLALPLKPLCSENCQGICPKCGTNLNLSSCNCQKEEGDPRLAILRNIKIKPKK